MPAIRLKVRPVTTSQSPHITNAARVRSTRGARRVSHSPATRNSRDAGSSHAIWPPISPSNSLVRPVAPQPLPPPTLPVSLPVSRPNPL